MRTKLLFFLFTLFFTSQSIAQSNICLNFKGDNDFITVSSPTVGTFGTIDLTLEAWVKTSNTSSPDLTIVSNRSDGNYFTLRITSGKIGVEMGGDPYYNFSGSKNIADDKWHHIAMVRKGQLVSIYIDGVFETSNSGSGGVANFISSVGITIGATYPSGNSSYFNGNIDEVRIWNEARTLEQILKYMHNPVNPAVEPTLKAYYNFNQGVAGGTNSAITTLTDLTSNNYSGTLKSFALSGTISNWIEGHKNSMQLVFNTTLGDGSTIITLPFEGSVAAVVDWGDGKSETVTTIGNLNHTYDNQGTYTVTVSGNLGQFGNASTLTPNIQKLTEVVSFGDLGLTSLNGAFYLAENLTSVPANLPSTITNLDYAFSGAYIFNDVDIRSWNVSNVTSMRYLFYNTGNFNQNLNTWNTQNVTNMQGMFYNSYIFNQDISSWNVSKVTNMSEMFRGNYTFNQPIGNWTTTALTNTSYMFASSNAFNKPLNNWNVKSVTDMSGMFYNASNFNQPLNLWNTENVTTMYQTFRGANVFNENISTWNTGKVTNMKEMFYGATVFNQNLGNWNVSNVTDMSSMFTATNAFNQDLNNWNVSKVTRMPWMFSNANAFNGNISSWNVSNVTDMYNMFASAVKFNSNISNWQVGSVTNMEGMFWGCTSFNQNLGNWNVGMVTNMRLMFYNCSLFNQNLNNWNVANVSNINSLFKNCTSFDQNLGNWNISNVTNLSGIFTGVSLSTQNYSNTLTGWSQKTLKAGLTLDAPLCKYLSTAQAARTILTSAPNNWTINDAGMAPMDLNTGLVAHYPFNSNANDESGKGYNGTVYGATLTTDRFGNANGAYSFNGTSSYISTGVTGTSGITNTITLCAWFKTTNTKAFHPIVTLRNGSYDVAGLYASTWGDGYPSFDYSYGVGYFRNVYANDMNYANNNWHFVVGTFDGITSKIYVDGVLKQQVSENIVKNYTANFLIGKDNGIFFSGSIDDIRIYNRTLSESEVRELYLLNVTVSADKNVACAETQIYVSQGITGKWVVTQGNGSIDNSTTYKTTIRNLSLGENAVEWQVFDKKFPIKINYQPPFAGNDTTLFSVDKPSVSSFIELKAKALNVGVSGVWTSNYPNLIIENSASNLTKVYNLPSGKHSFVWTVSDGVCSAYDELTVFKRTNINSDKSGNWNDELSWRPNTIPTRYDSVTIAGHNIYLADFTANAYSLVVKNSGNLFVSGITSDGILNLGDLWVFQDSKSTKGEATVNVKKGGKVNVEQGIDKNSGKTSANGKGDVKVKSGGKVNVEQGIDKLEGLAKMLVGGQFTLEHTNSNFLAASLFIGNNGSVEIFASPTTKGLDKLVLKGGGSIVIEQDVEAFDPALSVWGDILIENTNATKASITSNLTVKGGKVNVEQGIDKSSGNKVKVNKGGKVNVEQGIDKLGVASSLTAPELIITDGNVVIGNISGTVSGTSTLASSHISIFQNSKKINDLPNLLIAASGELQMTENPQIVSNAMIEVADSATMTVTLNASIATQANNTLTVFEIEDGGSVIIETPQPELTGKAVVNNDFLQGEHLFSSPVAGLNSSHLANGTLSQWFENQKNWQAVTSQIDFLPLQAFKYNATVQNTQAFSGVINAGLLSINLINSDLQNPNLSGWNLVGNPYTSALDWEMVSLENIENTAYRLNPVTQNYSIYQQGGFRLNAGNQLISMSEGFFVKVNPKVSSASFNLGHSQVHKQSALLKLEKPATKNSSETLMLTLKNGSQSDQTLLALETGTNLDFETNKDAFKLLASVPQIYTQSPKGENLAINILDVESEAIVRVPLFISSNTTGLFSIHSELNISIPKMRVFLHHLATDAYVNLSETTDYEFNVSQTGNQKLFEIVFNFSTVGIDDVFGNKEIAIYSNKNSIFINSPTFDELGVEIYNLLGSKIYANTVSGKTNYQIENQLADGIYFVKVIADKQTFIKQVLLKQF